MDKNIKEHRTKNFEILLFSENELTAVPELSGYPQAEVGTTATTKGLVADDVMCGVTEKCDVSGGALPLPTTTVTVAEAGSGGS